MSIVLGWKQYAKNQELIDSIDQISDINNEKIEFKPKELQK